jgi:hypothetical protein
MAKRAKRTGSATATPSKAIDSAATTPSKPMGQPGPGQRHTSAFPPRSLGNPSPSRPAPPRRQVREPEVIVLRRRLAT